MRPLLVLLLALVGGVHAAECLRLDPAHLECRNHIRVAATMCAATPASAPGP